VGNAIELVTTDGTNLEAKAEAEMAPIMQRAAAYVVQDEQSYLDADLVIKTIREKVKEREAEIGPVKEAATRSWKAAVALYKKYVQDPLDACSTLDRKRTAWKRSEDAKRQLEADLRRREEEKRQAEERLALATRMEAAGMKEQATKVLDAPTDPVNVPEPVRVETPKGQTIVSNWQARIVNPDLIPREYLMPDQVKINKAAKLMKDRTNIPGVVVEDIGSVRRRS
jgi:hypothetical protein